MIKLSDVNIIAAHVFEKKPVIIFEYRGNTFGAVYQYTKYITDYVQSEHNKNNLNLCVRDIYSKLFTNK